MKRIYLASASPRRRELLTRVGIEFELVDKIDESEFTPECETPAQFAEQMALHKAKTAKLAPEASGIVLGFDTIVVLDGAILGKPRDTDEAKQFLRALSGREHTVFTGVAAIDVGTGKTVLAHEATKVFFSPLSDDEIDCYVRSGEPMDKAGAYGIQELGALLVQRVDGCFYNVVGLPLLCLTKVLFEHNIKRLDFLT